MLQLIGQLYDVKDVASIFPVSSTIVVDFWRRLMFSFLKN